MLHFVPPGFVGLVEMCEAVVTRLFGREWAGSINIYEDTITGEISLIDGLPCPDEDKGDELAKRFTMAQKLILRALSDGDLTVEVDVGGARLAAPTTFWKAGVGWRTLQTGIIPEDLSVSPSLYPFAGRPCFVPREQFDRWLSELIAGLEAEPHERSITEPGGRGEATAATSDCLSRREQGKQETGAMYRRWYDSSQEIKADNKARRPIEIAKLIVKEERKGGNTKAIAETIKRRLNHDFPGWAD